MSVFDDQFEKVQMAIGFIAALDQSGGSTPKALKLYGVDESEYSGDAEMFGKIHEMRTRIMTNKVFTGEHILGAILFENTMDRTVEGKPTSQYLWEEKNIVPFLKIDQGLAEEADGVQLMKPIVGLDALLDRAKAVDVFGTKERSVIKLANPTGIAAVVKQQFEVGKQVLSHELVPIIEPEVDIHSLEKSEAEALLKEELLKELNALDEDQFVMLKLTLPNKANFYQELINHPQVLKVVALSGGYSREIANQKLSENFGMIASFSRALSEGLFAQQSEDQYTATLAESISSIYAASAT